MANDSNFDSWNKNHGILHNKHSLNLLYTRKSVEQLGLESKRINHLLNEIVGNQHSSKHELGEVQLRRINSAIYAEPINSNFDDPTELTVALSNISIDNNQGALSNTYRCEPFISASAQSSSINTANKSKSLTIVERRCRIDDDQLSADSQPEIQRYALNGHKVIHISTSLPSCALSDRSDYNKISMARNRAHVEWLQKKKSESVRKKKMAKVLQMKKKVNAEQLAHEKAERERKEHENFLMWVERKKLEDERKRRVTEKEVQLVKRLSQIEAKIIPVQQFHFRRWSREKEKIEKAKKLEQELQIKKREDEKRRRLEESSKAYELWREKSKNRAKPATQGLLPHQRATPSYINPIPWMVGDALSERQSNSLDFEKSNEIIARSEIINTIAS